MLQLGHINGNPANSSLAKVVQGGFSIHALYPVAIPELDGELVGFNSFDQQVQFLEPILFRTKPGREKQEKGAKLLRLDQGLHLFEQVGE